VTETPYQVLPPLSKDEYDSLRENIRTYGVQVPIVFDENGKVIDGHNRLAICDELGITDYPREVRTDLPDDQSKRNYARQLNLARRHVTDEGRRAAIADQIRETPDMADRVIARLCGVSPTTVGSVRARLRSQPSNPGQLGRVESEASGEYRVGADGRTRRVPARRPQPTRLPIAQAIEQMDALLANFRQVRDRVRPDQLSAAPPQRRANIRTLAAEAMAYLAEVVDHTSA
jgi:hypothetical protein